MNEMPKDDIRGVAEALVRELCCDTCIFMNGCGCFDRIAAGLRAERARNQQTIENLLAIIATRNEALERYENGQMGP